MSTNYSVPPTPPPQPPKSFLQQLLETAVLIGGVVLVGELLAAAFTPSRGAPSLPRGRRPSGAERARRLADAQFEQNRAKGRRMERAVERRLAETFEGAEVFSQVSVTDADGRRIRLDHVVREVDGVVHVVEDKNVDRVRGGHVRQLEQQRAALEHNGFNVGRPILAVRKHTEVPSKYRERVDVFHASMKGKKT